jgi:hypothetical protein
VQRNTSSYGLRSSDKLSRLVKEMRGQARITESNVTDMLREVRMALLEADVALPVVRDFIARVKEKALGQEVMGSCRPGQALVSIVNKELAATMGEGVSDINLAAQPPAVILMAGLQGSGKTTTTAKLAKPPDREAQEEGADGVGRRLPPGCHRAAQDRHRPGRRRMVPQHTRPEAGGHRPRRARLRQASTISTCCWSTRPAGWRSTKC